MCPSETGHLVLSYLLFCILLGALSLLPNLVNYYDFTHTAHASELSSSGNNTVGDDDNSKTKTTLMTHHMALIGSRVNLSSTILN